MDGEIEKNCLRCRTRFLAKGHWQTYCSKCFKAVKEEEVNSLRTQIAFLQNKLMQVNHLHNNEFDEVFLKNLIRLCHPDKHENSRLSNLVTARLLDELKQKRKS